MMTLEDLVDIVEFRRLWVKVRIRSDPTVIGEISFEVVDDNQYLPGTRVPYIGMWCGGRTIFEFQLGRMVVKPSLEDWQKYVEPLIASLRGYRPDRLRSSFALDRS